MSGRTMIRCCLCVALAAGAGRGAAGAQLLSDTRAIVDFQRAVDAYAFQHRRVERVVGETDQTRVTDGLKAMRADAVEGVMFSPLVADAFRKRIRSAITAPGCHAPQPAEGAVVPRLNESAADRDILDACIARALPRLPAELEYKTAGVVLLLVDAHNAIVVDVLHGAFPIQDN